MRKWKWVALVATGGMLLQFQTCLVDLTYTILQAAATQLLTNLVTGAATTT